MQEVILGIPFDEIEKNIDQYMPNVKCITGVVDTVLTENDSEAKKWWDEMKTTIIRLANIDMKKCMAIADPEEQLKWVDHRSENWSKNSLFKKNAQFVPV